MNSLRCRKLTLCSISSICDCFECVGGDIPLVDRGRSVADKKVGTRRCAQSVGRTMSRVGVKKQWEVAESGSWILPITESCAAVYGHDDFVCAQFIGEIAARDVGSGHTGSLEIGTSEINPSQVSPPEIGIAEVNVFSVHSSEIGTSKVPGGKITFYTRSLALIEFWDPTFSQKLKKWIVEEFGFLA